MKLQAAYANHPLLLLLCAAVGVVLGLGPPAWSAPACVVLKVSTALLNLVCMPLLVVCTLSGLRHWLGLPQPSRRLLMMALAGAALMLLSAGAGVLAAEWGLLGWQLDAAHQQELGQWVMRQSAADDVLTLAGEPASHMKERWALPDNVFGALSGGNLAAVVFCTLFFGLAFTAQRGTASEFAVAQLHAVSRALEKLISMVNLTVPLLVLAFAAHMTSQFNLGLLSAMSGFLLNFWALCGVLAGVMVMALVKLCHAPWRQVLQALKEPCVLSLVSTSPLAAVPPSIEGLSNRLGLSRGMVEMLMPVCAVFLRTGAALQFAMLAVFVAHLYDHQITPLDALTLAPVAVAAAWASAGSSGLASVGFATAVLAHLRLPHEAVLPLFGAIYLFSEVPARLLSFLSGCVLTAFVCGGLPIEKSAKARPAPRAFGPVRFALNLRSASMLASCVLLAGLLSLVLGMALGLRQAANLSSQKPGAVSAFFFLSPSPAAGLVR